MTIKEIIMKLVGHINFVGETDYDSASCENIKTLLKVIDDLMSEVNNVEDTVKGRCEYSARQINNEIKDLKELLGDYID